MRIHSLDMRSCLAVLLTVLLPVFMTSCLNPDLVSQTAGGLYPSAPGGQPFLLVRVVNNTQAMLDIPVIYDGGTGPQTFRFRNLSPEAEEAGVLLDWPVTRVNIGSLDSPFVPSIEASLPDGTNLLIPPDLYAAQAGVDFNRGDALVYRFVADSRNPAAIGVTLAKIDGTTQQGPFSRADTFQTVQLIIEGNSIAGGGS